MKHKALNQLLCAAVVNDHFRQTLLRNPLQAISGGYQGQSFALTSAERDLLTGIQARQLEDLANQVYRWVSGNGNGNGHIRGRDNGNGNGHIRGRGNGHSGNGNGHKERDREPWVELYSAAA